jgi:hypothetical protein
MIDFLETGLSTIAGSSLIASQLSIAGNVIEMSSNKIVKTAAKVCQSANAALLSFWLTANVLGSLFSNFWTSSLSPSVLLALAGFVFTMPIIAHLAEKFCPKHKEKIESFNKHYSTALKIINIGVASIVIGAMLTSHVTLPLYVLLSNGASIISSASSLYMQKHDSNIIASKQS